MESIIFISLLGVVAALLASYLRQSRPDFALMIILSAGVIIFALAIRTISPILESISDLSSYAGVSEYFVLLLKALGICYLTKFAADFCRDSGHSAVSTKIELAGRCGVMLLGLPLITNIVEFCTGLVK